MKDYNVVETELTKQGVIVHKVGTSDGKLKPFHYSAVRCGLNWPSPEAPGFYIILGEDYLDKTRFEGQPQPRGKLRFFKEGECPDVFLDKLFVKLTDDARLLHCGTIYVDLKEHEKDAEFYREWVYEKKISHGRTLEEAPYADNFALGISLIRRWLSDGLLDLPEGSTVRKQLRNIAKSEVESLPAGATYAINALRYAIGAFHKFIPAAGGFHPKRRKSFSK